MHIPAPWIAHFSLPDVVESLAKKIGIVLREWTGDLNGVVETLEMGDVR